MTFCTFSSGAAPGRAGRRVRLLLPGEPHPDLELVRDPVVAAEVVAASLVEAPHLGQRSHHVCSGQFKRLRILGGPHSTMESILALHPAAQGLILGVPEDLFLLRFIVSALLREWTVQSLIVDRTHLVLVCGKLVLQKN